MEKSLKMDTQLESSTYLPKGELIIAKKRGEEYEHISENYSLCYKFSITSIEPYQVIDVYIDAINGIYYTSQLPLLEDHNSTGTIWTWYNGFRNDIVTRTCGLCANFWLTETGGRQIDTREYNSTDKIKDNNNNWVENDTKTAASAHWSIQRAFDYFLNRHGRWGTDYNGMKIKINTKTDLNGSNAAYNFNNSIDNIYVRPDNTAVSQGASGYSAAMLDVMAHEYTHGMIRASSNLGATGAFDARSLNEAFADIFGLMVERNVNGTNDWTFAENMGTYQRNFIDPHQDFGMGGTNSAGSSASTFNEPGFWSTSNEHANGGIMRRWFNLLSDGGLLEVRQLAV